MIWLAPYSPQLNPKEREWRWLKQDSCGHLASSLPAFVDAIVAGLRRSGASSLRQVAAGMNARGLTTSRCCRWKATQVQRLLALIGTA